MDLRGDRIPQEGAVSTLEAPLCMWVPHGDPAEVVPLEQENGQISGRSGQKDTKLYPDMMTGGNSVYSQGVIIRFSLHAFKMGSSLLG